jgi:hypothetical protein
MTKKRNEKLDPKKTHTTRSKTPATEKTHVTSEKIPTEEKTSVTPEKTPTEEKTSTPAKTHTSTHKTHHSTTSLPPLTEKEDDAYLQFSEACKEVYDKFSPVKINDRMDQLKSSPALTAVLRFMVMIHDLLGIYGVMKFNKNIASALYQHLDDVQEQTGQKLPLARVLLDGIKATKMELLSGVTVHPLPEFHEPEYQTMASKTPPPADPEEFAPSDPPVPPEGVEPPPPQSVGPGGPYLDHSVIPQSGTPVDDPVNPPDSIHESPPTTEMEESYESPSQTEVEESFEES